MGIKYDEQKEFYIVSYSRRHPVTRQARNLRRQGIKTKAHAERVYRELIYKLAEKFNEDINPIWPEVVEMFLVSFLNKGVANSTYINYKTSLKVHTFEKWAEMKINKFSTSDIRDFIIEDLKDFSEAHKKSMLKFIKAVFRFAIEENLIQRDPTPKLKFKKNEKIKKSLTEAEVKVLLKEAKNRKHPWFSIWALACFTGMRNGELYALTWDKVDLNKRVMVVSEAWTKENGFKETKSGDDRIVEIAPSLVPLMKELYNKKENEFVLPRFRNWDMGIQSKILRDFLFEIDLPQIRFHDLRASWATIMLSKGIEPIKVMSMGGWKDLKTMQIYIRKSGINIRGITNSLELL